MFGTELVKKYIEQYKDRPILVYFDPDVDGLLAGRFVCELLRSLDLQYSYFLNSKRSHSFSLPPNSIQGFFIIAVDFEIDANTVKALVSHDVCLLSMDHHDIQDEFIHFRNDETGAEGVVINNQYPFEPKDNRYLSGAGVVFESIVDCYPDFDTDENRALVGVTLLSDVREIENKKARLYLSKTFSADTQGGYIGYLVSSAIDKDYGFGVPRLDRNFIDFSLSPLINSLLRFDRTQDALNFILGNSVPSLDVRKSQRNYVDYLLSIAEVVEYDSYTLAKCDVSRIAKEYAHIDMTCFIGAVCSKLTARTGDAIAYVYDNGIVTRASFRGKFSDISYRTSLESIGVKTGGHPDAFGILELEPSEKLFSEINEVIIDLESNHTPTHKVIETSNLAMSLMQFGSEIANENCYTRSSHRTYFKYTGNDVRITIDKENFREYTVNGRPVKCFDKNLSPENALILPMLEKGYTCLYLVESAG